jgi:hypothetical protein
MSKSESFVKTKIFAKKLTYLILVENSTMKLVNLMAMSLQIGAFVVAVSWERCYHYQIADSVEPTVISTDSDFVVAAADEDLETVEYFDSFESALVLEIKSETNHFDL